MNMISPVSHIAYDRAHRAPNGRRLEISPEFIEMWAGLANPGDRITYFRGPCLVRARFSKPHIDAVAACVLDLAAAGLVAPMQRRDNGTTIYFMEKVSRCFLKSK